jgi:3-phosphoshikimate 1-carboxyvinyltransferase
MIAIKLLDHCDAAIRLPGSKSYTQRALILAALADGESILADALRSEDTGHTAEGLEKFGARIFWETDALRVQGTGGSLKSGEESIFVGNSGTSMRFLTALAALKKGITVLDGSERMRKRPIADLLDGLRALGAKAYFKDGNGCPPLVIESQGLRGGVAKIRGDESSQFLSALLMVAPYALGDVSVEVTGDLSSRPYVDMTREVMSAFGVKTESQGYHSFFIKAGQHYVPRRYWIEGDASTASYFFSAAAVTKGRVRVENFPTASVQGDVSFLQILEKMGCEVIRGDTWAEVHGKELRGIEIDMNATPDLVPTLAVTSAFARGKTIIQNISHLRFKESDRIGALMEELKKMGIQVEEGEEWLAIEGGGAHGAEIDTHDDHRLAMSFAILGLVVPGMKIKGEECVAKSFPDFWKTLGRLYR